MERIFTEPHSTKPIEDATGWALETDGETLAADRGIERCDAAATGRALAAQVVLPGPGDARHRWGARLAEGEALAS